MKNFGFGIENYKRRSEKEKRASTKRIKNILKKYLSKQVHKNIERIIDYNYERFSSAPGSAGKHQPWEGGYFDHLQETFEYAIRNFDKNIIKFLPKHEQYTLGDVLLVLFFHDIEKPYKYFAPKKLMKNEYSSFSNKKYVPSEKEIFANSYNILFSDLHRIAIHYVHGENERNYHKLFRRQSPLGAAVGNADRFSARVMFNMGYDVNGKLIRYSGPNMDGVGVGTLKDIVN